MLASKSEALELHIPICVGIDVRYMAAAKSLSMIFCVCLQMTVGILTLLTAVIASCLTGDTGGFLSHIFDVAGLCTTGDAYRTEKRAP